jgi:regulator of sigma E protease
MQNFGYFIVLLGVLVTVHELGHFLVAKACGVKVLKFSIGFGPKLVGFTKGETEYLIALLPLGGYVKMAGDVPGEELTPEEASRGFLAQPPWKRAAIVFAGPFFNLVFPILVYFFVFLGPQQVPSTRVGIVEPGSPAAVAGIRPGDRVVAVDGEPVKTYSEMLEALVGRFERPVPLTVEREGQQVPITVTPAKRTETSPIDTVQRGDLGVRPINKAPVVGVPADSAAAQAGLKTFDRILAVNGVGVGDEAALNLQLEKAQGTVALTVLRLRPVPAGLVAGNAPDIVEVKVPKQAGEGLAALGAEPADLYIATVSPGSSAEKAGLTPGARLVALNGEPIKSFSNDFQVKLSNMGEKPFELTWRINGQERTEKLARTPLKTTDAMGQAGTTLAVGVAAWDATATTDLVTVDLGPGAALKQAALVVPKIVGQMVKVLGGLFVGAVSPKTIGGPIMMYQLAGKAAERGLDDFLHLMAVISINLGVMNLLPIPVLDGFHLLSAAWEGIRRRPIPVRVREVANMVGLAVLILLMLLAVTNDITR